MHIFIPKTVSFMTGPHRKITAWMALAVWLMCLCGCASDKEQLIRKPLNIVLVVSDAHSPSVIGAYNPGSSVADTPGIDTLAIEGNLFRNCIATGWEEWRRIEDSLPGILREKEYRTAFIGSWDHEGTPDRYDMTEVLEGEGDYYNPMLRRDGRILCREGYVSDILTEQAAEWLSENGKKERFFLVLHHHALSGTWMPSTEDLGMFNAESLPQMQESDTLLGDFVKRLNIIYHLKMADKNGKIHTPRESSLERMGRDLYRRDLRPYDPLVPGRMNGDQQKAWDKHYDPIISAYRKAGLKGEGLQQWKYRRFAEDYLETANSIDRSIRELHSAMKENGLLDNTVFIYTSTRSLTAEESSTVPLIIRMPDSNPAENGYVCSREEVTDKVSDMDLFNTLLELTCTEDDGKEGKSFVPLLLKKAPENGDGSASKGLQRLFRK